MERVVEEARGWREEDAALQEGRKAKCGEESDPNLKAGSVFRSFSPASSIRIEPWKRECRKRKQVFEWPDLDTVSIQCVPTQQASGPGLQNGCSCRRSRALRLVDARLDRLTRFLSGCYWMLLAFGACKQYQRCQWCAVVSWRGGWVGTLVSWLLMEETWKVTWVMITANSRVAGKSKEGGQRRRRQPEKAVLDVWCRRQYRSSCPSVPLLLPWVSHGKKGTSVAAGPE